MRSTILFITLFLFSITLFAQNPAVVFHLNDGSSKSYNIDDINYISMIKYQKIPIMTVYYQKNKATTFNAQIIDSIKFERVNNIMSNLLIYSSGEATQSYKLSDIDSIIFLPLKINNSVKIGNQVWMTKNLDVTTYRNGDPIPECTDSTLWINLTTGAWCYYNNDPANNQVYGKLYNWYAVNDPRGLAPEGWHVGNESEWIELIDFVGGEITGGNKLKEAGTLHWTSPNPGATNETGFTAVPAGYRIGTGFGRIGDNTIFWMSEEFDATTAYSRYLYYNSGKIARYPNFKGTGFSVRCVKD